MNIDKNYFSARLAAGEDIDAIGQDIAKAMNEALEEYRAAEEAKKAAAAKAENESAKRDIVREMVELIQEYAILEGMDGDELETSEEDIEQLVDAFTSLFAAMRDLKALVKNPVDPKPVTRMARNDDQILADFVSLFN
jgi:hypothetical protein